MKNKILALTLALAMVTLAACGGTPSSSTPGSTSTPDSSTPGTTEPQGLTEAIAEQPVLLTTVGQSADVEMVKVMLERAEIPATSNNLATSADLGDSKTLILAIGGSSKGLGAAGIDADQELARVKELIDAADEAGIVIIAMHIGGEARRGELSDKFIPPSFEKADYAIVVAEGDKDGLMSGLAGDYGIPIDVITSIADAVAPLKAAFK